MLSMEECQQSSYLIDQSDKHNGPCETEEEITHNGQSDEEEETSQCTKLLDMSPDTVTEDITPCLSPDTVLPQITNSKDTQNIEEDKNVEENFVQSSRVDQECDLDLPEETVLLDNVMSGTNNTRRPSRLSVISSAHSTPAHIPQPAPFNHGNPVPITSTFGSHFPDNGMSTCARKEILPRKYLKPRYHMASESSTGQPSCQEPPSHSCSHFHWPRLLTWSKCCEGQSNEDEDSDIDIPFEDEPFRKRCSRACFTFVYIVLASVAVIFTYSMIQDLITSMNNPVRSIHYTKVTNYDAPGIAVYPGGAKFLACGHYYNNVVTSKVSLTQLDLQNHTCNFTELKYTDPHYPDIVRDVTIMRGPTSFVRREAIFLHFELEDQLRDFFTVSYFVFPDYEKFKQLNSSEQGRQIVAYHRYVPTFALSAGLRMWIKLIMSESHLMDGTKHTDFKVEWKNDIIEQSYLIYTTTPWSIGAGLCGVFLTLHRGYQLSQTSYKRVQKDKEKRSIRKRTLREMRKSRKTMAVSLER